MKKIKQLSTRIAYENKPFVRINEDEVEFATGVRGTYSVVCQSDFVMIVAIDENNDVYIIKQHRYPVDDSPIEFPAGMVNEGEDIFIAAHRELEEELGVRAETLIHLGSSWVSSARSTGAGHYFLAQDLTNLSKQSLDETEAIAIIKVPYAQLDGMIEKEEINDQHVVGAKYYVDTYLQKSNSFC